MPVRELLGHSNTRPQLDNNKKITKKYSTTTMVALRSSHLLCSLIVIFTITVVVPVSAKRGCSAFGHSCFGGHGKRSDSPGSAGGSAEEMPQQPPVLPIEPLALPGGEGYNYYEPLLPPRAGPNGPNLVQAINSLPPIIRQWLASYRRAADNYSMD